MQRHVTHQVAYYTFDSLRDAEALVHAISTRHGGVSPAPFATLNLGHAIGDDDANVDENTRRLYAALALDATATVTARQAHGAAVAIVDARHRGARIANVDALVTNTPAVPLLLRYADCVPILLYDPKRRAIGLAHAGWRGTLGKIATQTVQAMRDAFGTRPRDLIACLAPSIGACCYRVGDDVIARVRVAFDDADALLIPRDGGIHLDLWEANARQLRALGIAQIEIAGVCVAHHTDEFYSWRAEGGRTGRFGAIIALNA